MFIAGWGNNAKKIAYLGVLKCGNCKNHSHHHLYEVATKITLFFVPVGRVNSKFYVACSICDSGFEIDAKKKQELLSKSLAIPNENNFISMMNELNDMHEKILKSLDVKRLETMYDELWDIFHDKYERSFTVDQLKHVYHCYVLYVTDDDTPS